MELRIISPIHSNMACINLYNIEMTSVSIFILAALAHKAKPKFFIFIISFW